MAVFLTGMLVACESLVAVPEDGTLTGTIMLGRTSQGAPEPTGAATAFTALDGQALAGTVDVFVEVSRRVDVIHFHLDGDTTALDIDADAPFELRLDTTTLADGPHVLTAMTPSGRSGSLRSVAEALFSVVNETPSTPEPSDPAPSDPVEPGDPPPSDPEPSDPEPSDPVPADPDPTPPPPDEDPWAHPSGPLVIRSGGTYSGTWESLDPKVAAVTVLTSEPVVLENAYVRGVGHLISAPWSQAHLTVRNVQGMALRPTEAGRYPGRFVHAEGYRHVTIENSSLADTSGIYLNASTSGATVRILRNRATNIDGRKSDGAGGYAGVYYVQFVQLNSGRDLVDSEIAWNEVVNDAYASRVEDVISLYATTGTATHPVVVHDNFIHGAYPLNPAVDGYSGGGIMLGDGGGAYLHAINNHVVGTTNYGIAISGGHDNRIDANRVVSCGLLEDGTRVAAQNVGIYVWNIGSDPAFARNTGSANQVAWASKTGGRNDWWVPNASLWTGNVSLDSGRSVGCEVEAQEHQVWLAKADLADVVVGPTVSPTASTLAALAPASSRP